MFGGMWQGGRAHHARRTTNDTMDEGNAGRLKWGDVQWR
jgi:hypothetical protein